MLHFYYTNFVSMNTVNVVGKHDWFFPGTKSGRISNEWKKKKQTLYDADHLPSCNWWWESVRTAFVLPKLVEICKYFW